MGKLVRFITPNQHKRIFLYGNIFSPDGPWNEEKSEEVEYNERIIIRDSLGIVIKEHQCKRFKTTFYGVITVRGDMGWVHCKNVEVIN